MIDSDKKGVKNSENASKEALLTFSTPSLPNLPSLSKLLNNAVKGLIKVSYGLV